MSQGGNKTSELRKPNLQGIVGVQAMTARNRNTGRARVISIFEASMRSILAVFVILSLSACSGGGRVSGPSGPISDACIAADRSAANRALCSCVQQAANQTLSGSEQSRAAGFFGNPDLAQAARTADSASAERFWGRYRNFTSTARAICG